jgi:hypothetical protein
MCGRCVVDAGVLVGEPDYVSGEGIMRVLVRLGDVRGAERHDVYCRVELPQMQAGSSALLNVVTWGKGRRNVGEARSGPFTGRASGPTRYRKAEGRLLYEGKIRANKEPKMKPSSSITWGQQTIPSRTLDAGVVLKHWLIQLLLAGTPIL